MKDYSQHGEGKIISDMVSTICYNGFTVPHIAVELGAGDGFILSNIRGLMEDGWDGFQIDKERSANKEVAEIDITTRNVNDILLFLKAYSGIDDIGVISIDVDGNDLWIWKAMIFDPCIVCIEFNPTLSGRKTIKYDAGHRWTETDSYFGASFQAVIDLGHRKGYKAIAKTPCNLIFCRADLWPDPEPELTHVPVAVWPASEKEFEEVSP
jgi:hypothetical protein